MFKWLSNIFCGKNQNKVEEDIFNYSKENDILLIPLVKEYNLANLYPKEDEVEHWSIFIVGSDKTYILAKLNNKMGLHEDIKQNELLNNVANHNNMSKRFKDFLDKIWDKTLNDAQIQIFIYMNSRLSLLNSYPLKNKNNNIIGAVCFIREAGLIDKTIFANDERNTSIV